MDLSNIEIEHKFLVSKSFDTGRFRKKMLELGCKKRTQIDVKDTYYVSDAFPGLVFRHRLDSEIQHLTIKAKGIAKDARQEINLKLLPREQTAQVIAFLRALAKFRKIEVKKRVEAFYFSDCEIVFYTAKSGRQSIACVEFEAVKKASLSKARKIIEGYERAAGFASKVVESRSLFEMLVLPQLNNRANKSRKTKR